MVSKVKALLRRFKNDSKPNSTLTVGNIEINREEYKIINNGQLTIFDYSFKIDKYVITLLKIIENYNILGYYIDLIHTYYISYYKINYYCDLLQIKVTNISLIHKDEYIKSISENQNDCDRDTHKNYKKCITICDISNIGEINILYNNLNCDDSLLIFSNMYSIKIKYDTLHIYNNRIEETYIVEYMKNENKNATIHNIDTIDTIKNNNIHILIVCVIDNNNIHIIKDIVDKVKCIHSIELTLVLNYDYNVEILDYILRLQDIKNIHIFHEIDVSTLYTLYKKCTLLIKFPLYNRGYNTIYELCSIHKNFNVLFISDTIKKNTYTWDFINIQFIDFIKNYKDNIDKSILYNNKVINHLI